MSQNRLRRLISEFFPNQDYEELMSLLESQGKSRSKLRDVKDFTTLIEISEGNFSALELYAQTATDRDLETFQSWLHAKVDYLTGPQESISFFAAAMIPLAKVTVELNLSFSRSLGSVILFDARRRERYIYLVPTVDQRVFVTKNREAIASGKVSSNLTPYEGQFLACEEVADFIARNWSDV